MTDDRKELLKKIAAEHGTPLFVIDDDKVRENYRTFKAALPSVQPYVAIKANPDVGIVETLYDLGASFDVASLGEFTKVYECTNGLPDAVREDFIRNRMICANTIKPTETLRRLNGHNVLMTFDNSEELKKIRKYAPDARLVLRIRVPNVGSMVELSSKFGALPTEAVGLIKEANALGLPVEGVSFHVGSQCTNFDNYTQALEFASTIFKESALEGLDIGFTDSDGKKKKILDIGGGFPVPYTEDVKSFRDLAEKLNTEIPRLFPDGDVKVIAEPGRFMVATAGTVVVKVVGKSVRDGKTCYYVDDGVYHTFSGQVFDHQPYPLHAFKDTGEKKVCTTFGPTCDAFDTISRSDELPEDLQIDDLLYAENIGAYSTVSTSSYNGIPPAKVVHINRIEQGLTAALGDSRLATAV